MTNLTDEGLKQKTVNVLKQLQVMPWCRCADETNEDGHLCDYCVILSELKQVRDAAKKEEREKVRVLAWGLIKNDKLDTAIRQME